MSKQKVHFSAFGYEPSRMKPVHFATGFFLSLIEKHYKLELLNKTAVIKHKDGLKDDYSHDNLLNKFVDLNIIYNTFSQESLKMLRVQFNGIFDNDNAMFPIYPPYSSFGNDYTIISDRFLTSQRRKDGYAGYLVHQILKRSIPGNQVLSFALKCITNHDTPLEKLATPILDDVNDVVDWDNQYPRIFGDLSDERLDFISQLMEEQTNALALMCDNLEQGFSHHTKLRYLIIALCSWLFLYIQKYGGDQKPLLFMDFTGGDNRRLRTASRNSFSRQREYFYESYRSLNHNGKLDCDEDDYNLIEPSGFKFLDEHFSDLAVRIGFAQPRAPQVKFKHFELQPDTIRIFLMSIIKPGDLLDFETVSIKLRDIWGVCMGACADDQIILRNYGIMSLDIDEDLDPNTKAFINILKQMNLAVEPSDGLVICSAYPEESL